MQSQEQTVNIVNCLKKRYRLKPTDLPLHTIRLSTPKTKTNKQKTENNNFWLG